MTKESNQTEKLSHEKDSFSEELKYVAFDNPNAEDEEDEFEFFCCAVGTGGGGGSNGGGGVSTP